MVIGWECTDRILPPSGLLGSLLIMISSLALWLLWMTRWVCVVGKQSSNKLCVLSFSIFCGTPKSPKQFVHPLQEKSVTFSAENSAWLCTGLAIHAILKLNVCAMIWLVPSLQFCFSSVVAAWLAKSLKWSNLVLRTGLSSQFCWEFLHWSLLVLQ